MLLVPRAGLEKFIADVYEKAQELSLKGNLQKGIEEKGNLENYVRYALSFVIPYEEANLQLAMVRLENADLDEVRKQANEEVIQQFNQLLQRRSEMREVQVVEVESTEAPPVPSSGRPGFLFSNDQGSYYSGNLYEFSDVLANVEDGAKILVLPYLWVQSRTLTKEEFIKEVEKDRASMNPYYAPGTRALLKVAERPDGTKDYAILIGEPKHQQRPQAPSGRITGYHRTSLGMAKSIIKNGFYQLPGRWTFTLSPARHVRFAGQVILAFDLSNQDLIVEEDPRDKGKGLLAFDLSTSRIGAALPAEMRQQIESLSAISLEENPILIGNRTNFLVRQDPGSINVKETLAINAESVKQKLLSPEDYEKLKGFLEAAFKTSLTSGEAASAVTRAEVRKVEEMPATVPRVGEGRTAIQIFLPDLTAKEIVDAYLQGNQAFETFVKSLGERALERRDEIDKQIGGISKEFFTAVTNELLRKETREEILEWFYSRAFDEAIQKPLSQLNSELNIPTGLADTSLLRDLVRGAATRVIVFREAAISERELAEAGRAIGFEPSVGRLLFLFSQNLPGLESLLNEAVKDEGFREWHRQRYGSEAPAQLFEPATKMPEAGSALFDISLFEHLFKEGNVELVKNLVEQRMQVGRVGIAFPQRMSANFKQFYIPGVDSVQYKEGDEFIDMQRVANQMSRDYLEAILVLVSGTRLDIGNFRGFGVFTDSGVIRFSKLDPSSFVRLLELTHRSEYLWKLLEADPEGRDAFRRVTANSLSMIVEFFNQLVQTKVVQDTIARAA
jgi:hypothetical protein